MVDLDQKALDHARNVFGDAMAWGCEPVDALPSALVAYLAALPVREAVAWRVAGGRPEWSYYDSYGAAHVHELHSGNRAQPLYTHPAPSVGAAPDVVEALKPFLKFADQAVVRVPDGWVWAGYGRERISDWFGPSDFGLLAHFAALASASPDPASGAPSAKTIPNYPEYDNARNK